MTRLRLAAVLATLVLGVAAFAAAPADADRRLPEQAKPTPTVGACAGASAPVVGS